MAIAYKQLCTKCKKNYVIITYKQRYAICYDCQKKELGVSIRNPAMKKLFDVSEEYYKNNSFLRDIKLNYIKYKSLSEKQIEAFKKTVKMMKSEGKIKK